MSYNIDFVNNERYSADDINAVRAMIMTKGVIKKGDEDCLVTLLADGVHINAGEALFDDGCRIELTEPVIISYTGDGYVYFDRNYYGTPEIKTGDVVPDDGVVLAQITGGAVVDKRNFVTLKLPTMAPNRYNTKYLDLNFELGTPIHRTEEIVFEDRTDVSYIIFYHKTGKYSTKVLIDFVEGCIAGSSGFYRVHNHEGELYMRDIGLTIQISKTGNKVTFDMESSAHLNYDYATITAV